MADVVGVIFQNGIKTYYFDPAGLELARGDRVVVQTMRGTEIGQVVDPPTPSTIPSCRLRSRKSPGSPPRKTWSLWPRTRTSAARRWLRAASLSSSTAWT